MDAGTKVQVALLDDTGTVQDAPEGAQSPAPEGALWVQPDAKDSVPRWVPELLLSPLPKPEPVGGLTEPTPPPLPSPSAELVETAETVVATVAAAVAKTQAHDEGKS